MSVGYAPPPKRAYITTMPFDMPTPDGNVWTVSFTIGCSQFLNGAIAVVFTLIFPSVGLVTLHNSPDPWTAFKGLLVFAYESFPSHHKPTCGDFALSTLFGTVALAVFITSIVMGIVGPPLLQIGNVAPVRPGAPYYPQFPAVGNALGRDLFNGYRSLGVLRALSSVEVARVAMRSKVNIEPMFGTDSDQRPTYNMTYTYNLTGPNFGLAHSSDLEVVIGGFCQTQYSWFNQNATNVTHDAYNIFGRNPPNLFVSVADDNIVMLPRASFIQGARNGANISYAIVVGSAHRPSISPGNEPWYATEPRSEYAPAAYLNASQWVKNGRPPLSCWQRDQWRFGDTPLPNITAINNVPGKPIPEVLVEVLNAALRLPLITVIGPIAGQSALESVVTSPGGANINGLLDASAASVGRDMERLIVASFVYAQNVLVDSTSFQPSGSQASLGNIFTGSDGRPREGTGQFVVATPDVQTFDLVGLIVLAVVLATLILLKMLFMFKLILHAEAHEEPPATTVADQYNLDRWARFKAPVGALLASLGD
ncbi:hypothetical protein B0T25DRAFT_593194 [Lasiosphaeria hispida]|uniref:Uncharacterized protein n=1 Tax=Lasiosphaeria hispida TaxID=260671 RepID=A0AAJ0H8M9_9PEZI|nr:hypothetical protein B0T25DRAFT_593194 [Lasiosphaeria hispida]